MHSSSGVTGQSGKGVAVGMGSGGIVHGVPISTHGPQMTDFDIGGAGYVGVGGSGVAVGAKAVETARAITSSSTGNDGTAVTTSSGVTTSVASEASTRGVCVPCPTATQITAAAIAVKEIERSNAVHCWMRDGAAPGGIRAGGGNRLGSTFMQSSQLRGENVVRRRLFRKFFASVDLNVALQRPAV